MHEFGIAQHMVKTALDHAAKSNATRITALNIALGAMADENQDVLCFHLENLTRGTIADGARFNIERRSIQARCVTCGNEFTAPSFDLKCPRCGNRNARMVTQDDFALESINVEP